MERRRLPALQVYPILAGVLVVLLLCFTLVGLARDEYDALLDFALVVTTAVAYGVLGPWVWLHASPVFGRRLTAVGVTAAIHCASQAWSTWLVAAWLMQWTWLVPIVLVPLALTRFPDGARPLGWRRAIEFTIGLNAVIAMLCFAVPAMDAPRTLLTGSAGTKPGWTSVPVFLGAVFIVVWFGLTAILVADIAVRGLRSSGVLRGQYLLLNSGLLLLLVAVVGLLQDAWPFQVLAGLCLPVAIGLAVFRYSLYDLDLFVRRVPVWLVLTGAVVAGVTYTVMVVRRAVPAGWSTPMQVISLTVLVIALAPTRSWLQAAVDRMLFGFGRTPDRALGELGLRVSSAAGHGSAEELCRSIGALLAVPWVSVIDRRGRPLATWGRRTSAPEVVPLLLDTREVGTMHVCPRRPGEHFTPAERQLMNRCAVQVAVAVEALALAHQLQVARERLVRSREDERKRLRDDLHDGLGPALTGLRMQLHTLGSTSAAGMAERLRELEAVVADCVKEVRQIIEGLRPIALEAGLSAALRSEAARLTTPAMTVSVDTDPEDLSHALAPAVETAAYRISSEALVNAAKHSGARSVSLRLLLENGPDGAPGLSIEVVDNGTGGAVRRAGRVGLESMRERAEELGGALSIEDRDRSGTAVTAWLPGAVLPPVGDIHRQHNEPAV
jgi:signal transduction histidine kinase